MNGDSPNSPAARLLVVDDDENNRDMISRRLARRGFNVVMAIDGFDALRQLQLADPATDAEPPAAEFDLVLLDIEMPGLNGFDVLRRVRQAYPATRVPVIIATARHDREDIVQALGLGANDYVTKPLDFAVVLARVETQLSHKRSVDRIVALEAEVRRQNGQLLHANARMRNSLASAARVQQSLLPTAKSLEGGHGAVEFAWAYRPCDELGGDIFNVFPLPGRDGAKVSGLYLLDVSGHGVPAALLSVTLSRMLTPVLGQPSVVERLTADGALEPRPPAEVAGELNRRFPMSDLGGQYFTLVYGVLETGSSQATLRYVLAGHPPAMVVPAGQAAVTRPVESADFAVGWFDDAAFEEHVLTLHPGDRCFIYSDGVTETMNERADHFGEASLAEVLNAHRSETLPQQIAAVLQAVDAFRHGEVLDDVSLLAVAIPAD